MAQWYFYSLHELCDCHIGKWTIMNWLILTSTLLSLNNLKAFFSYWLHWVFVAVCGPSRVATSGGYYLWGMCFSLRCLLSLQSMGSRAHGLQKLWHMGLAAPWHVWSSQTRDQTRVPCIGRWILNHRTTREVLACASSFLTVSLLGVRIRHKAPIMCPTIFIVALAILG